MKGRGSPVYEDPYPSSDDNEEEKETKSEKLTKIFISQKSNSNSKPSPSAYPSSSSQNSNSKQSSTSSKARDLLSGKLSNSQNSGNQKEKLTPQQIMMQQIRVQLSQKGKSVL